MTPPALTRTRRSLCAAALHTAFGTVVGTALGISGRAHAAPAREAAREAAPDAGRRFAGHAAIAGFAAQVAARRQLPRSWLLGRLERARRVEAVRRLILPAPAGTPRNWRAYRERFVEPHRIGAGLAFWRAHEAALAAAEARFGVPAAVVLGIVGVETFYGRVMGSFRVVDALATLAFDFPPVPPARSDRSGFFRAELEEFLVWCAREGRDPLVPLGSFAGAMGLPQFMPSSLNRFAIDFDGDGRIDLDGNGADVAGSVARYLAEHGWQRGMATHYALTPPSGPSAPEVLALLREKDIAPSFTAQQLGEHGAGLDDAARAHEGLLAYVELDNGPDATTQVAGTANFYAITRYNRSSYYAMAVIALAEALAAAR